MKQLEINRETLIKETREVISLCSKSVVFLHSSNIENYSMVRKYAMANKIHQSVKKFMASINNHVPIFTHNIDYNKSQNAYSTLTGNLTPNFTSFQNAITELEKFIKNLELEDELEDELKKSNKRFGNVVEVLQRRATTFSFDFKSPQTYKMNLYFDGMTGLKTKYIMSPCC